MPTSPPDEPHGLPAPANPFGIKLLRFFLWLLPAGLAVGWTLAFNWLQVTFRSLGGSSGISTSSDLLVALFWILGIGSWIATGWFDSMFSPPCRTGKRSKPVHAALFVFSQLLITPAVLIAVVFAICTIMPLQF